MFWHEFTEEIVIAKVTSVRLDCCMRNKCRAGPSEYGKHALSDTILFEAFLYFRLAQSMHTDIYFSFITWPSFHKESYQVHSFLNVTMSEDTADIHCSLLHSVHWLLGGVKEQTTYMLSHGVLPSACSLALTFY